MHPAPPSRAPLHLLLLAAAATVLSAPIDPYQREEIQNLIARSQFDDADRIMRAVLIDHPEDTDMICLRGTVAVLRDDPRQAETLFREALQRRAQGGPLPDEPGRASSTARAISGGFALYARINKNHPVRPLALYKQVLCFLLSGDRASASTLVESLDLTPGDPAFLYAHAALAYHDGDVAAGRYFSESARRLYRNPSDVFRLPLIEQGWITD
ncbi:MAG: hypothetical protein U1G05_15930 [Kiritimatiellia bacterium]